MATSIVSVLTQTPVSHKVAMTGEITLRGRALKIGGLKEKIVAAHRAGIEKVLIPKPNEQDLQEIPSRILKALEIVPVEHMDQVLTEALALDNPEAFLEQLERPLLPPEVLRGQSEIPGQDESEEDLSESTSPPVPVDDRQLH